MTLVITSRTIVVGYDGSPAADAAVEHAIDRSGPHGRLVIVHAYDVPVGYAAAAYYAAMQLDAATFAESVMDRLQHDCERLATIEYERDVAIGPAGPAIVRAAEDHDADEIVVGSRGNGRVRVLLGSVAHDVIHRARCPVTVIPERSVVAQQTVPLAAVPDVV